MDMIHRIMLGLRNGIDVYFVDMNIKKSVYNINKKSTFTVKGLDDKEYSINRDMIKNDTLWYHSKCAEPINWKLNETIKYIDEAGNEQIKPVINYFVDSTEFYNNMNNKVMQMLLYVKEKNILIFVLIISALSGAISFYTLLQVLQILNTMPTNTIGV